MTHRLSPDHRWLRGPPFTGCETQDLKKKIISRNFKSQDSMYKYSNSWLLFKNITKQKKTHRYGEQTSDHRQWGEGWREEQEG